MTIEELRNQLEHLVLTGRGKQTVYVTYQYDVDDGDGYVDTMEGSDEIEVVDGSNCLYIQRKV